MKLQYRSVSEAAHVAMVLRNYGYYVSLIQKTNEGLWCFIISG